VSRFCVLIFENQNERLMKIKILLFSSLLFLFFSCKKDHCEETTNPSVNESYYPLTPGSYWTYQWYKVDTLENAELMEGKEDFIKIIGDTIINNNIYAIVADSNSFETSNTNISYQRDSLGYLIDERGNILFSNSNFIDTLDHFIQGSIYEIHYRMDIPPAPITTPLNEFDCLNFKGEVTPFIPVVWDERDVNNYYSKGVGLVLESTFFFSSFDDMERRLIEYHIE